MTNSSNYSNDRPNSSLKALEEMVAKTCFCKLRTNCEDKNNTKCLQHRNLYAEVMLARDFGL